ncbi:MAG: methyltransferase domain-containing protein [Betaproteobacteria bacterium]|nr:methyltransferase domain-containing protein [Betaproteobacteria bacterium]
MTIERSREPEQFAAFELSGWESNIGGYDRAFGVVARQTVRPMLDAARLAPEMRVLDVCCGPGMLAAGALERGAATVGLDFSTEAVELARALVPTGRFQQGDAQALPFTEASFDAVLCGYGLMHLPEPGVALREMLRVLRPGGRAAVSVWDAAGVGFSLVYEAVRARGSMNVALPHGPDFFQFGSAERMRAALAEAGFADVEAHSFLQTWHVADADRYVEAILTGTVRARAVLAAQSADATTAVHAYIADYLTRFRGPAGNFIVPMPAIIGSGVRPG